MSRRPEPPYTAADLAYMHARPTRFRKELEALASGNVEIGDAVQPPEGQRVDASGVDAETREWVEGLNVEELKEELADRNLAVSGKKPELQMRLLEALAND